MLGQMACKALTYSEIQGSLEAQGRQCLTFPEGAVIGNRPIGKTWSEGSLQCTNHCQVSVCLPSLLKHLTKGLLRRRGQYPIPVRKLMHCSLCYLPETVNALPSKRGAWLQP